MKKWLAAALLLVAIGAPGSAQMRQAVAPREPFPLSVFSRLPETERPRISTDGSALAAKVRVNGEQVLAIIPLDTPDARPQIIARDAEFDERDQFRTTDWDWIDPDNLLIWVASRTDLDGQKVDATRVIAYNRRTRRTTRHTPPPARRRSTTVVRGEPRASAGKARSSLAAPCCGARPRARRASCSPASPPAAAPSASTTRRSSRSM